MLVPPKAKFPREFSCSFSGFLDITKAAVLVLSILSMRKEKRIRRKTNGRYARK